MPPSRSARRSRWAAFGPGLLFAGAAVGVSHLVQSTRGGAEFGLVAAVVVVLSCVVKWPAFRYGTLYAAATGNSLLVGYRHRGRWTLVVFGLMTLAVCFTTLAAVTSVTAGLLLHLVPDLADVLATLPPPWGSPGPTVLVSLGLILVIAVALATGGYRLLERVMKFVVPVLTVATLLAAILAIPELIAGGWGDPQVLSTPEGRGLAVGMVGWMPAPIDIAVWSSIWTLAKIRTSGRQGGTSAALVDFDAGYASTMILAVAFVMLGASVMHGSDLAFEKSAAAFAGQVVDLYAVQLGAWTRPVVATAAFLTMLSTTLTVADGFPRSIAAWVAAWRTPSPDPRPDRRSAVPKVIMDSIRGRDEAPTAGDGEVVPDRRSEGSLLVYWLGFVLVAAGAVAVLNNALDAAGVGFTSLVDLVTGVSFLVAPVLVFFNLRCVTGREMPPSRRPGLFWQAWGWLAVLATGVFAAYYAVTLATG